MSKRTTSKKGKKSCAQSEKYWKCLGLCEIAAKKITLNITGTDVFTIFTKRFTLVASTQDTEGGVAQDYCVVVM